jgi:hypothetical protein
LKQFATIDSNENPQITKIAGEQNEDILDYIFLDHNRYIQLTKIKKTYFLKVPEDNNVVKVYPLDIVPKSLYKDVAGKIYVLTKEKAFQIAIYPTLEFKVFYTVAQFENNISKLIVSTNSYTISNYLDRKSNAYGLIQTNVSDGTTKILTYQSPSASNQQIYNPEKVGKRKDYNSVNRNRSYYEPNLTFIKTGKMTRQTRSGSYSTSTYNPPKAANIELYNSKNVYFSIDSLLYTFDLMNNKMNIYNIFSSTLKVLDYKPQHGDQSEFIFDKTTNNVFQSVIVKGVLTIYKIDLKTGNSEQFAQMNIIGFEKNIKINNGEIYFTKTTESGFNKLYRVSL